LERLLKVKERQKEEEPIHMEDTQRLVIEIEMPKVVFCIWVRRRKCCRSRRGE
jgi:hypothetical protein